MFTAKYILTTSPFEPTSVDGTYEEVFEKLVEQGKFKLVKSFDMGNGYVTLIYERVKAVEEDEINEYEKALQEESKQFPELYKDILEEYKKSL